MSMKRKKVGHEQGLSVQLSIVGHFFLDAPKRNCLGTYLGLRISPLVIACIVGALVPVIFDEHVIAKNAKYEIVGSVKHVYFNIYCKSLILYCRNLLVIQPERSSNMNLVFTKIRQTMTMTRWQ